jgi:hypothetical protein
MEGRSRAHELPPPLTEKLLEEVVPLPTEPARIGPHMLGRGTCDPRQGNSATRLCSPPGQPSAASRHGFDRRCCLPLECLTLVFLCAVAGSHRAPHGGEAGDGDVPDLLEGEQVPNSRVPVVFTQHRSALEHSQPPVFQWWAGPTGRGWRGWGWRAAGGGGGGGRRWR